MSVDRQLASNWMMEALFNALIVVTANISIQQSISVKIAPVSFLAVVYVELLGQHAQNVLQSI